MTQHDHIGGLQLCVTHGLQPLQTRHRIALLLFASWIQCVAPQVEMQQKRMQQLSVKNRHCVFRSYFAEEWAACCFDASAGESIAERLVGQRITVSQQSNGWDCGVFLPEFAQQLLEQPATLEAMAAGSSS